MSFQSSVENCSNPIRNKNLNHSFGEKPLEKASGIEILHRVVGETDQPHYPTSRTTLDSINQFGNPVRCFSNRHVNFGLDMITNLPTPQDEKVYDHSDFVNPSFFKEPDPFYLGPELESFSTAATSLLGNKGITVNPFPYTYGSHNHQMFHPSSNIDCSTSVTSNINNPFSDSEEPFRTLAPPCIIEPLSFQREINSPDCGDPTRISCSISPTHDAQQFSPLNNQYYHTSYSNPVPVTDRVRPNSGSSYSLEDHSAIPSPTNQNTFSTPIRSSSVTSARALSTTSELGFQSEATHNVGFFNNDLGLNHNNEISRCVSFPGGLSLIASNSIKRSYGNSSPTATSSPIDSATQLESILTDKARITAPEKAKLSSIASEAQRKLSKSVEQATDSKNLRENHRAGTREMQKDIQTGSKVANALIATKESGSPINKPNPNSWRKALKVEALTSHIPRRRLTVEQEQILLKRFAVQEYLSKREMEELAEELKIPTSQLRTWFGNRRSKLKAAARQKAKMKAGMGHLSDADLKKLNKKFQESERKFS